MQEIPGIEVVEGEVQRSRRRDVQQIGEIDAVVGVHVVRMTERDARDHLDIGCFRITIRIQIKGGDDIALIIGVIAGRGDDEIVAVGPQVDIVAVNGLQRFGADEDLIAIQKVAVGVRKIKRGDRRSVGIHRYERIVFSPIGSADRGFDKISISQFFSAERVYVVRER